MSHHGCSSSTVSRGENSHGFPLTRTSAHWDPEAKRIFIHLCEEEIIVGHCPGTNFTPKGWRNIIDKFYAHTRRKYTKAQFKNQWDTVKSEYVTFNELMHRETGIKINPITNTIDVLAEWWDHKIKHEYHNLFTRILATSFISRCPIQFSQTSGTETCYGQEGLNDYKDSKLNKTESSDESDGPTCDDNIARTASTNGLGQATSCVKRKSTWGLIGLRKNLLGPEFISDSINQLVACQRDLDVQNININTWPKILSILECMDMIDWIDLIEKGTSLYFFAMDYISTYTNREVFADLSTLELKFGIL
ncbi:Myb DNA-bind 3 domain-containing protein [Abeliophyllum distichum]|uniref:Myb DNA-bind 3 domain-containing protein n=1 Tax=Abeliophyllum distichum TaxID=126358 RepID=A0ABD1QUS2_9LAMI